MRKNIGKYTGMSFAHTYLTNLFNNGFKYNPDTDEWSIPDNQKKNFFNTGTENIIEKFDWSDYTFFDPLLDEFYNELKEFLEDQPLLKINEKKDKTDKEEEVNLDNLSDKLSKMEPFQVSLSSLMDKDILKKALSKDK